MLATGSARASRRVSRCAHLHPSRYSSSRYHLSRISHCHCSPRSHCHHSRALLSLMALSPLSSPSTRSWLPDCRLPPVPPLSPDGGSSASSSASSILVPTSPSAAFPAAISDFTLTEPEFLALSDDVRHTSNALLDAAGSTDTGLCDLGAGARMSEYEPDSDARSSGSPERLAPWFECSFYFLPCRFTTHDEAEWRKHCLEHFHGHEPPHALTCPLCDHISFEVWGLPTADGSRANGWHVWTARQDHVAATHHRFGQTLRAARPDFRLFEYLWRERLISDQDYGELIDYFQNRHVTSPDTNGRPDETDHRR